MKKKSYQKNKTYNLKNMKLNCLLFLIFYFLVGCTSNLNKESIKNYNNYSLNEFIKDRFTINNTLSQTVTQVRESLPLNNQRNLYEYYSDSKSLSNGAYVFYAPFTGSTILEKPKKELSLFCESRNGKLKTISKYNYDILSSYQTTPIQSYILSVRELSNVRVTNTTGSLNVSRPLTDTEINSVAVDEAIKTANENRYSDIAYARKDYHSAWEKESFGLFSCVYNVNKKILWSVSIIPIAYEASDKEHFILDALYIGIKGNENF